MKSSSDNDERRVNPVSMLKQLKNYYGDAFTKKHGTGLRETKADEEPKALNVWVSAMTSDVGVRYSNAVAANVMQSLVRGTVYEQKLIKHPPTPGELAQMFRNEADKLCGSKMRYRRENELAKSKNRPTGLKNGVPQGFDKYQTIVDKKFNNFFEKSPGLRERAEGILEERGGRIYAKFMLAQMGIKFPNVSTNGDKYAR